MASQAVSLQAIGERSGTDKALLHKYLDFYEEWLPKRDFEGRLLEIGVYHGDSLRMWTEYYPEAEIVGIDTNTGDYNAPGATVLNMNAVDIEALKELGNFDIIIDDGSHYTLEQQISFYWLYYNQLNSGGWYIMEDLHTSFMPQYLNSKYSTMEVLNRLKLKAYHFHRDKTECESITAIIEAGQ